jgi:hypothetical protein
LRKQINIDNIAVGLEEMVRVDLMEPHWYGMTGYEPNIFRKSGQTNVASSLLEEKQLAWDQSRGQKFICMG